MKRFALPWGTLRLAAVVALIMATALVLQRTADDAQAQSPVPTKGTVSSVGVPPVIECKWELPDMENGDSTVRNPYPDPTFEYGTDLNVHQHDDNMAISPTPINPCALPPAPTGGSANLLTPTMASGAINMMHITANPGDLPSLRRFQLWMAVDHPNGIGAISDVFWDVFHPDGTPKTQVHGIKIPLADCGLLGSSTAAGTMFEAAVHTGQIAASAVDDPNRGMVAKCFEQEKAIYFAEWTISKEQPCGDYVVVAHAVSSGVEATVIRNSFHVNCFFSGQIDFNTMDFGTFSPGTTDRISGDLIFDVPPGNVPTIRNVGNIGMEPAVEFHIMCNSTDPITRKCITQFDVSFGTSAAQLQHIDPIFVAVNPGPPLTEIAADHTDRVDFDDTRPRVLCADQLGKMDFSMHPPNTLPAGTYSGSVDIFFQAVRGICPTDQEHIPPFPNPAS